MDQALLSALDEAVTRIPVINPERQYWFIRTNGGAFYDDFWETKSVGIGYNLVTLAAVNKALANQAEAYAQLQVAVFEKYKDENNGKATGLMWRFMVDMKPGDIVVMPSGGSNKLAFGEVTDGAPFEVDTRTTDDDAVYRKRRSVNWVLERGWYDLDSNVRGAFAAPQALTQITRYGDYLDREMYAIYTKGGETHVRLDIQTVGGIDGDDYFDMGHSLLSLCREFRKEAGIPDQGNRIEVRSNVQSPGIFEFITHAPAVATFLASILVVGLFGGRVKVDSIGLNIGTDGLLKSISEFLTEGKKRDLLEDLRKNLHSMDANLASDLVLRLSGASPSSPSAPPAVPPPPAQLPPGAPPALPASTEPPTHP